jgi:hypothetical protein
VSKKKILVYEKKGLMMHTKSSPGALREIERAQVVVARHSEDNGVVLLVWGITILLDMIVFDVCYQQGYKAPVPAVVFMCCLNPVVLGWRFWYVRHLPIQPLKVRTNKIIFYWSFYYMALTCVGAGVFVIGVHPPFFWSLLGILVALPLLISGWRLWCRAHEMGGMRNGKIVA